MLVLNRLLKVIEGKMCYCSRLCMWQERNRLLVILWRMFLCHLGHWAVVPWLFEFLTEGFQHLLQLPAYWGIIIPALMWPPRISKISWVKHIHCMALNAAGVKGKSLDLVRNLLQPLMLSSWNWSYHSWETCQRKGFSLFSQTVKAKQKRKRKKTHVFVYCNLFTYLCYGHFKWYNRR